MAINKFRKITYLILITLIVISCGNGQDSEKENKSTNDARASTDISFELLSLQDERVYTFEDFRGKPTVINFWASWCVPCRNEMPFLQNTWEKRKKDNFNIIGINVMDNEDEALEAMSEFHITYNNLFDRGGEVSAKFGILGLPATIFINNKGEIVRKYSGPFLGNEGEKNFKKYLGEIL